MNATARRPTADRDQLDAVAAALADGTRRRLLQLVRDVERSAGELAAEFPDISRPAVSQHLGALHAAGLVTVRADGKRRMYRARTEGLVPVSQFVDDMWSDRLLRLKHAVEHTEGTPR
jgi:DNA-binding transcriptional ArsR family regulator